ncbi:MAG: DMT family transporter [Alphaproteobacteria bacterium]
MRHSRKSIAQSRARRHDRAMDNAAPLPAHSRDPVAQRNLRNGVLLMVVGVLLLPGIDAIAKGLAGSISAGQVAWARFFFQSLLLLPFVIAARGWRVKRLLWVHGVRGVMIAAATLMFFASLAELPLADAVAIFFVEPLVLTLLCAVFLGERVGWRRLLAVVVGFGGALIIIRPSFTAFGTTALLPLGAALAFAIYLVLTRFLIRENSAVTLQFYAGIFGCITLSGALWLGVEADFAVLTPVWPTQQEWMWLALLAVIATTGHLFIVVAVRRVGASIVAPFQYLEIISATLLGLVLFGDFPDPATWVGVAVIIGSGLYVYVRERKIAGQN